LSKFLIIQTAFIGDVILATAIIEKLALNYPGAKINFLLRKGNESLILGSPKVNEVLIWDKSKNKYAGLLHVIKKIRKEKYDYVINLHRFASSGLITTFSGKSHKIGFANNPLSFLFDRVVKHSMNGLHETVRNQKLIADITDENPLKPKLYISQSDYDFVLKFKIEPYYCIAPCSVWFTKQFPMEKWKELISILNKKVFLVGGLEDTRFCEGLQKAVIGKDVVNLSGKLTLLQTAALMKDAEMNYVNDSAPLHLASAVNAPVTAIYCSTIPEFGFGPLSQKSKIVQTKENLACRPCGIHGYKKCPKGHFKCASTISVNQFNFKND